MVPAAMLFPAAEIIGFAPLISNIINCACHPERLANMTKLISFFLFFNNALYQVHIICFKCYFDVLKLSCKLGSWCAQRQRHKNYSADVRSVKFCQNLDGTHHVKRFFLRKYLYQPLVWYLLVNGDVHLQQASGRSTRPGRNVKWIFS